MKAAICEEANKIVIKEIEEPKSKQDEVLIKVESVGISRLDILAYMGRYPNVKYPIVLGSEFCGEIAALGKKVEDFEIGDKVIVEPYRYAKNASRAFRENIIFAKIKRYSACILRARLPNMCLLRLH